MLTTLMLSVMAMASGSYKGPQSAPVSETRVYLYTSYGNYTSGMPADSLEIGKEGNQLKPMENNLILKEGKMKRRYANEGIYGYTLDGNLYRYADSDPFFSPVGYFRVVDTSGLVLYEQRKEIYVFIGPVLTPFKQVNYYYSKDLHSSIKKLSRRQLKRDFDKSDPFLEKVLAMDDFPNNSNRDSIYKINSLYRKYE